MRYSGRVNIAPLLNSGQLRRAVETESNRIALKAKLLAPRDTGALATSIQVKVELFSGLKRDRVVGHVQATAPHAASQEFGSSGRRGAFFLRRAVSL